MALTPRALLLTLLVPLPSPAATPFGPTPYLSLDASPFSGTLYHYFHLETFEDNLLNTPGASAPNAGVIGASTFTDSVDADDGLVDGFGRNGHSLFAGDGGAGITVNFDPAPLGGILPSDAGLVWTDGVPFPHFITLTAFDASLTPIATVSGIAGDNNFAGGTAEDRFFGIRHLPGIARIRIQGGAGNGIEIDHLQYGRLPFLPGDFNFDNAINSADLTILNNGFAKNLTGYHNGDISLNGPITRDDYPLFDRAHALATLSPSSPTTLPLPEPTTLFAVCPLALLPLNRRPRPS